MKIKEIQGFPNKKKYPIGVFSEAEQGEVEGYNECLQEIGDMEIEIDVEQIRKIIWGIKKYYELEKMKNKFLPVDDEQIELEIAIAIANSKSILKWRKGE